MCVFMTEYIYNIENIEKSYSSRKIFIKNNNLKNYKTHKKFKLSSTLSSSSSFPSSSSSSLLSFLPLYSASSVPSTFLPPATSLSNDIDEKQHLQKISTLSGDNPVDVSFSCYCDGDQEQQHEGKQNDENLHHYRYHQNNYEQEEKQQQKLQQKQRQQQLQHPHQYHHHNYYSKCSYPKFISYRTNCDLYLLIPLLIMLILITITNCSESNMNNLINYNSSLNFINNNNNDSNGTLITNNNSNEKNSRNFIKNENNSNFNERLTINYDNNNYNDNNINANDDRLNRIFKSINNTTTTADNDDVADDDDDLHNNNISNNINFDYSNNFNAKNLNDYYYFQNLKKRNRYIAFNNGNSSVTSDRYLESLMSKAAADTVTQNGIDIDDEKDIEKLQQLVLQGLGLSKLPDVSKINISQSEYITKYNEYILRVRQRKQRELLLYNNLEYLEEINSPKTLKTYIHNSSDSELYLKYHLNRNHRFSDHYYNNFPNLFSRSGEGRKTNGDDDADADEISMKTTRDGQGQKRRRRRKRSNNNESNINSQNDSNSNGNNSPTLSSSSNDIVYVRFPIKIEDETTPQADIEEANLRLLLMKFKKLKNLNRITNHSINNDHNNAMRRNANSNVNVNANANANANSSNNDKNSNNQSTNNKRKLINLKVYQLIEPYGRIWLDGRKIEVDSYNAATDDDDDDDEIDNGDDILNSNKNNYNKQIYDSQWLDFDVTKAVESWTSGRHLNLGLEIHCENCERNGIQILHTDSSSSSSNVNYNDINNSNNNNNNMNSNYDNEMSPVLNIIGRFGLHRDKRSRQNHHFLQNAKRKPRKTDCYEQNKKCCRHSMEVVFKEIKGFEFIIQPKVFDAGYCRGKCPPRYNPAHHHALLQSLIWKQDKSKAPRPCCAPSKLVELEVLHVDEKDPKKLKVSTWTDMRALECACS